MVYACSIWNSNPKIILIVRILNTDDFMKLTREYNLLNTKFKNLFCGKTIGSVLGMFFLVALNFIKLLSQ